MVIKGSGFPSNTDNSTASAVLGGVPCDITSTNFTTILCTTRARAANYTAPSGFSGLYPAMRGASYEFFPTT